MIHDFGWTMDDHDRLAAGTLCGHIIECGAQCNGGNFTDWRLVPDYDDMGFPVAGGRATSGSFVLGKPDNTGGLITPATVAEQMLYEIGESARLPIVPDVVCGFAQATYEAGRQGPRARVRAPRAGLPTRHLQGLDHLTRRLQAQLRSSCWAGKRAVAKGSINSFLP